MHALILAGSPLGRTTLGIDGVPEYRVEAPRPKYKLGNAVLVCTQYIMYYTSKADCSAFTLGRRMESENAY
jgi:hypothetical protein